MTNNANVSRRLFVVVKPHGERDHYARELTSPCAEQEAQETAREVAILEPGDKFTWWTVISTDAGAARLTPRPKSECGARRAVVRAEQVDPIW